MSCCSLPGRIFIAEISGQIPVERDHSARRQCELLIIKNGQILPLWSPQRLGACRSGGPPYTWHGSHLNGVQHWCSTLVPPQCTTHSGVQHWSHLNGLMSQSMSQKLAMKLTMKSISASRPPQLSGQALTPVCKDQRMTIGGPPQ